MEGQVSTEITQLNCKFITRLEKLKNLFEKDLQDQCEKNILFQQTQNWVDILSSYKDLEKAHNEFNMNNPGKQKKMDNFEIDLLKIVVKLYCNFLKIEPILMGVYDWDQIGSILFNRHWKVCRSKWLETQATSIVDHPWTREEDQILSNLYEKYSKSNKQNKWSLISIELSKMCKSAHVRQGKQCRERWINKLNPLVNKGPWYKEEEIKLLDVVLSHGKKWSLISKKYFNKLRTENCLKNRFHTILKRESTKFEKHITQKQNNSKISLENEQQLILQIIQELREESILQKQSEVCIKEKKQYMITSSDLFFDLKDNFYQIVVIKKNKLNPIV